MMNQEEMSRRVNEMPAEQWFTVKDIAGQHHPGLWMHLCHMDDSKHYRADGCLLVGNTTRTQFVWQSPSQA